MRMVTIAALAAAQLMAAAAPVQAGDLPREEEAMQPARAGERVELALADAQAPASEVSDSARENEPVKKKRKSTGDKILTGAAVVLGVGALAVGGLLVAIFVG